MPHHDQTNDADLARPEAPPAPYAPPAPSTTSSPYAPSATYTMPQHGPTPGTDGTPAEVPPTEAASVPPSAPVTPTANPTRIAIYDDLLSAPRIVDVEPRDPAAYIEEISTVTYTHARNAGGAVPYTVVREVCENFIHAGFAEPCISILDGGNTIRFSDQGPGIADKERAQLPGFTTATTEQRRIIKGVGSGLPTVREYLKFANGRLFIEDNLRTGTVVTISMQAGAPTAQPVVWREEVGGRDSHAPRAIAIQEPLDDRERTIVELASQLGEVGPTDLQRNLGLSLSTAYRMLTRLEERGLVEMAENRKRVLTDLGRSVAGAEAR